MPPRTVADVWFDPSCPYTRVTSRWLLEVAKVRPIEVRWQMMSLSVLNENRDDDSEGDPEGYLWAPVRICARRPTRVRACRVGASTRRCGAAHTGAGARLAGRPRERPGGRRAASAARERRIVHPLRHGGARLARRGRHLGRPARRDPRHRGDGQAGSPDRVLRSSAAPSPGFPRERAPPGCGTVPCWLPRLPASTSSEAHRINSPNSGTTTDPPRALAASASFASPPARPVPTRQLPHAGSRATLTVGRSRRTGRVPRLRIHCGARRLRRRHE